MSVSTMNEEQVRALESAIGISFGNKDLLKEAITHRSYLNENAAWPYRHNERLEFLGDAVLEIAVTRFLFDRFPEKEEGELTAYRAALVNARMLCRVAKDITLHTVLLVSRGESRELLERRGEAILADAVEALIGAIYLDKGYEEATRFIEARILPYTSEVVSNGAKDPKSLVQEIIQERYKVTPNYRVLDESGPAHERFFTVGIYFGEELKAKGQGYSKQEAEVRAAEALLEQLKV